MNNSNWHVICKTLYSVICLELVPKLFTKPPVLQKRLFSNEPGENSPLPNCNYCYFQKLDSTSAGCQSCELFKLLKIILKILAATVLSQNAGGPQSKEKAEWMEESLETWFYENKDLEPYEVWCYPLILNCTKIHILIGGGVLGWHHWGRIPVADWWWILERGVYNRNRL